MLVLSVASRAKRRHSAAPLVVVEFGHGTLPLRGNAEDCCSVPCICECGQVGPCLPTLLVKIAGWFEATTHAVRGVLGLAFVIAMIAVAPPAMSRTVAAPATERILDDSGGRIGSYLTRYEALRKSGQHVAIDGTCASACTLLLGVPAQSDLRDAARGACLPRRLGPQSEGRSDQRTRDKIFVVALSDGRAPVDRAIWWIAVTDYLSV